MKPSEILFDTISIIIDLVFVALILQLVWNNVFTDIFGFTAVTYKQATGIVLLKFALDRNSERSKKWLKY